MPVSVRSDGRRESVERVQLGGQCCCFFLPFFPLSVCLSDLQLWHVGSSSPTRGRTWPPVSPHWGSQGAPVLPFKSTSSASSSLPAQQDQAAIRWPQAPVGRQVLCTCVTAAALNVSIQITCLATENASSADLKEAFFAE